LDTRPYGFDKDTVTIIGFVVSHFLRKDYQIIQPKKLTREKLDELQGFDVRSPGESDCVDLVNLVDI
jgi:hypothetical protein